MAAIALITQSTADGAYTRAAASFAAAGHTVTGVLDSAVGSTDFSPFALVATVRTDASALSATAAALWTLNQGGKPLLLDIGVSGASDGATLSTVPSTMGLCGQSLAESTTNEIRVTRNDHPVTNGLSVAALTIFTATGVGFGFEPLTAIAGDYGILAVGDDDQATFTRATVLPIERGTYVAAQADTTEARIVLHHVYAGNTVNASYDTLLAQAVTWALDTPPAAIRTDAFRTYAVADERPNAEQVYAFRTYAVADVPGDKIITYALRAYVVADDIPEASGRRRQILVAV